ncbi:extradiol ring-cleavage dioxygenase class III protein subunit B [Nostoc sp. PCC 7107]|nr:extradiol ring-cleavage dioxygenase class III protein subunit B [Nostoc sp. PCC 7107]AFY45677.1 extradiol ring-cleavage dioxygenase class III protein subunit B [Nostoc sp. PCC 7107]
MTHLPTVFISHGAPDLLVKSGAIQNFLRQFPQLIPQPNASQNVKPPL